MQLSSFSAVMQLLSTHTTRLYCHLFTRRACTIIKHEVTALIAKRCYAAVNYVEFLEFHQSADNLVLWPDPSPLRAFNLGVGSGNETTNSFSARHEFVCKIHCVRWKSIARLFSTTRSRDGSYHEKGYQPRPIALFMARVRAGPRGDGSARAYCIFYASLSNVL